MRTSREPGVLPSTAFMMNVLLLLSTSRLVIRPDSGMMRAQPTCDSVLMPDVSGPSMMERIVPQLRNHWLTAMLFPCTWGTHSPLLFDAHGVLAIGRLANVYADDEPILHVDVFDSGVRLHSVFVAARSQE